MLALKRFVTVVVMVYLLLTLLFFLVPSVRATVAGFSPSLSALEQERQFFYWLAAIGAGILGLHLLTENADSALLRREVGQYEGKVNELKAKLYDNQQQAVRPASTAPRPVVEAAAPAPPARPPEAAPQPGTSFTISANPDAIPRQSPYRDRDTEASSRPDSGRAVDADGFPTSDDRPMFSQSDPSLSNTPPADRPSL